MSNLLDALAQDAATLVESELPAPHQIRTILGALVKHVEALQAKVLGPVAAPVQAVEQAVVTDAAQAVTDPAAPAETAAQTNSLQAERDAAIADIANRLKALVG